MTYSASRVLCVSRVLIQHTLTLSSTFSSSALSSTFSSVRNKQERGISHLVLCQADVVSLIGLGPSGLGFSQTANARPTALPCKVGPPSLPRPANSPIHHPRHAENQCQRNTKELSLRSHSSQTCAQTSNPTYTFYTLHQSPVNNNNNRRRAVKTQNKKNMERCQIINPRLCLENTLYSQQEI